MDNNRPEGIGQQVKGVLKEGLGKIIGDAKLTADGAAERATGQARAVGADGDSVIGIDTDRIAGVGHQLKGALKEGLGSLAGNPELAAEGTSDEMPVNSRMRPGVPGIRLAKPPNRQIRLTRRSTNRSLAGAPGNRRLGLFRISPTQRNQ